jgi:hypothetical protein
VHVGFNLLLGLFTAAHVSYTTGVCARGTY